jgi:16S rRNA (cytosine967-C5)-methyltransferase
VELVKRARKGSAAPFANAVLRKLASASTNKAFHQEDASTAAALSQKLAHPLWLVKRWERQFGLDRARHICNYDQHAPAPALRLTNASTEDNLRSDGIDLAPGQLISSARRVRAGNVSVTRAFGEGRVAIQDEASQLVALLVGKGSKILDCCAAPGGKTRVLAERNPKSGIVALELHEHRSRLLRQLVPAKNVEVITSDVLSFNPSAGFDRVLADVPCSGTGTLAHNPEIKWRLNSEDLADLQGRQLAILRAAMRQVSSGGRLIYSTCSLEPEENEEVVEKALSKEPLFRIVDCRVELEQLRADGELVWSDLDSLLSGRFVRTIPGVHPCDGFFVAILQRD